MSPDREGPAAAPAPDATPRISFTLLALGSAAVFAVLAFVAVLLWTRNRAAQLSRGLDAELAHFQGLSAWRRPAPRGGEIEGDAASAQRAAIAALGVLDPTVVNRLGAVLRGDAPVTDEMRDLVRSHAVGLSALRESVRRAGARSVFVCDLAPRGTEEYRAQFAAVRSVLLLGELTSPGECLRACEDAVRLGQDMVPGGNMLRLMVSAAETELAVTVAARCARGASREDLAASAAAFERIAQSPPPAGEAFEAEFLGLSCMLRGAYARASSLPGAGGGTGGGGLGDTRTAVVMAWELIARDLSGWQGVRGEDYPAALETARARFVEIESSRNPVVVSFVPEYESLLNRDIRAQARLRALSVLLAGLAEHSGAEPPSVASHPSLRDPFTGTPLVWASHPDGTIVVYSRGPDRRDDGDARGSDDVGVKFADGHEEARP